ncbi:MAG: hypothetical protein ACOYYJ_15195 [Chloroflexota bacterium]
MQAKPTHILFPVALSYTAFLLAWGIGQAMEGWLGKDGIFIQLTFFMVVYIALTGIAIPLWLARRFGFALSTPAPKWRKAGGFLALGIVLVASVFFSDALPLLKADPPSAAGALKYLLLFVPMALGICLQCFFLAPRSLEAVLPDRWWRPVLVVAASALAIGLGFWVDQLFASPDLALTQVMLGVFFALGALLTRSFAWTYACYLVAILVNTLSEGKYFEYPWAALGIGFVAACLAVLGHAWKNRQQRST